jgi:hypothetical protein
MRWQPTAQAAFAGRWAQRLVIIVLVALCGGLAAISNGNPVLPLAPLLALVAVWALLRVPLGWLACAALFVALAADNPNERPGHGLYKSVLYPVGELFYLSLAKTLKAPGLKVFGIEAMLVALATIAWLRRPHRSTARRRPPRELWIACAGACAVLIALWIYGLGTGGVARFSMLQARPLLFMTLWPLVFALLARDRRFVVVAMTALVGVTMLRSAVGLYYWATILRHGIHGPITIGGGSYVTTHSDSLLSVVALLILGCWVLVRPSLRSIFVTVLCSPLIVAGLTVNNRRLAYVAAAMAVAVIFFVLTQQMRRRIYRVLLVALPVLLLYVAAAWNSDSDWAKPIRILRSVKIAADTSAQTRDIENFNLMTTAKRNPLFGIGIGKPYDEVVQAYTIADQFEAFLYVPHNSVLWLLSAGGVLGLGALWLPQFLAAFFAARLMRRARRDDERVLALVSLGYVVAYGVQAFGDMGIGSWMGALILGALLGLEAMAIARLDAEPDEAPFEVDPAAQASA